ncbi:MAG TPA: hypothetical protein VND64_15415 [Pirellulales bacterium]|nr:hypothetical protein [Pirellulales bacterium]
MTAILPLITATAVGLFAMQPRTVWRQGGLPASGAKNRRAAERAAPAATQPVGGVIDDPLPRDYERSGRGLPGPVLRPAGPADGGAVRRRAPATAGLTDVIPPVRRAAANKPVESEKSRRNVGPPRYEADEPAPEADATVQEEPTEPDEPQGPSLGSASPRDHSDEPEERERFQEKRRFRARSEQRKTSLSGNEAEEKDKTNGAQKSETTSKKAPTRGEPPSPSDGLSSSSKAAEVPSGALIGLFASLGTNVFLIWVAASQRRRFRALVRDMYENDSAADHHANDAEVRDDLPHWESVDKDTHGAKAARADY